jgi:predicted RNase H-like nuclease (RuvC/YqgF family)
MTPDVPVLGTLDASEPRRPRAELMEHISRLEAENAELRSSLLRWRVAAVAKWADTAADAMETAGEVKELKRQLHESELDRLDIGERHHQLNQLHHQLNERYLKLSRRHGNISRLSEVTGAGLKRRIGRVVGPLSK